VPRHEVSHSKCNEASRVHIRGEGPAYSSQCWYHHPHDANNPQVGHWGNCTPRWWPQGSTFSSSKTKQRTHKAKRGELNGLVVYADVRIQLTLYSSSCSTRYELNLLFGGNKQKCPLGKKKNVPKNKIVSQRHHIKGSSEGTSSQRKTPQPAAGAHMRWHVHSRRKGHLTKKTKNREVGRFFLGGPSADSLPIGSVYWLLLAVCDGLSSAVDPRG
jgi:hypothetical protein